MEILELPLLSDNYAWILKDDNSKDCAIVDPSEVGPVLKTLREKGLKLISILVTHHHWDHTGGIQGLRQELGEIPVFCSGYDGVQGRVPGATHLLEHGEHFVLLGHEVQCLEVPGHTLGAIAYYVPGARAVFTGDTLFTAGCGRLFEGTPEQMLASLRRLAELPRDTLVYCGHEYTEKNLRFALSLESDNEAIRLRLEEVSKARRAQRSTVPARLDVELQTNPFLRTHEEALVAFTGKTTPVEVFGEIREQRNEF